MRAGSRYPAGRTTSSTGPAAGAQLELGAPKVSGENKACGDGSLAVSENSAGRALKGRNQLKEQ